MHFCVLNFKVQIEFSKINMMSKNIQNLFLDWDFKIAKMLYVNNSKH